MNHILDWKKYSKIARTAVAESCVLLRNESEVLPLESQSKVAIFGRMQFHYIKSGTGSGGLVNAPYVTGVLDALEAKKEIHINQNLLERYREWVERHPFDRGKGWAQEPWAQVEMPLTDDMVIEASEESEVAIVMIGRQAGEDRDNGNESGSYLLQPEEERMLELTTKYFEKVVVLLNVGNIMDMKWVEKYQPQSVLYIWQGGCEGGNGAVDVLLGTVSPSGKLTDTIAYDIHDYPSTKNFGSGKDNVYQEDIYVGYRYFETFAPHKVMYPFGYGLSYTSFSLSNYSLLVKENVCNIKVKVEVENTGNVQGKEVVQVYVNPPQGKLGKPVRNLVAFGKTKELKPNETQQFEFDIELQQSASYDDSGITGYPYAYVLEAGQYELYVGTDVRTAEYIGSVELKQLEVVEVLTQACAPIQGFTRMVAKEKDERLRVMFENVPLRKEEYVHFRDNDSLEEITYSGEQGYMLQDVKENKITLNTFLAQLSDEELIYMTRGEGMCSPKVTPGTAGAIGGVTDGLMKKGIPLACCADGPSGIRMDSGSMAFSLPNGTALASTFNTDLNEELFTYLGMEMSVNCVDTLLGPGINIHRNPLNGRNFEYFSEDPYVTGKMAVAQLSALHRFNVTGTIKHFACNNQEYERSNSNSVVSERALREIYLKGYEMAVKESGAYSIMSSYGALNDVWTASNYDLLTTILRNEWEYDGIVMTDWWAKMNEEGGEATMTNTPSMIKAQNDVYMVVDCAEENTMNDETEAGVSDGRVTRGMLIRSAKNICTFLMKSACSYRLHESGGMSVEQSLEITEENRYQMEETRCTMLPDLENVNEKTIIECVGLDTSKGASAKCYIYESGKYTVELTVSAEVHGIAQVPVTLYCGEKAIRMLTLNRENCKNVSLVIPDLEITVDEKKHNYVKLFFAEGGITINQFIIKKSCV